jgi:hypothetical protein
MMYRKTKRLKILYKVYSEARKVAVKASWCKELLANRLSYATTWIAFYWSVPAKYSQILGKLDGLFYGTTPELAPWRQWREENITNQITTRVPTGHPVQTNLCSSNTGDSMPESRT